MCDHKVGDVYVVALVDAAAASSAAAADEWLAATAARLRALPATDHGHAGAAARMMGSPVCSGLASAESGATDTTPGRVTGRTRAVAVATP